MRCTVLQGRGGLYGEHTESILPSLGGHRVAHTRGGRYGVHGHCVVLWNKAVVVVDIAMCITMVGVMVRMRGGWQVSEAAGAWALCVCPSRPGMLSTGKLPEQMALRTKTQTCMRASAGAQLAGSRSRRRFWSALHWKAW